MRWRRLTVLSCCLMLMQAIPAVAASDPALVSSASQALRTAADYFHKNAGRHGAYVWEVTTDLTMRRGEDDTDEDQGWSQPPGTPSVGRAFLAAYQATGDQHYLDFAVETADALVATQLESGGWAPLLEYDPEARLTWCYRVEKGKRPPCKAIDDNDDRNATTLDDRMTQSALAYLILMDRALYGQNPAIREAVNYGLGALMKAQYPNGSWPIRVDRRVPSKLTQSAWRARLPEKWSREHVKPSREVYIFNDDAQRDMVSLFLLAYQFYEAPEFLSTSRRAGEFFLRSQLPGEQAGWAQTYNANLEPIWGRKFEPPAVASSETAGIIDALLDLHVVTGEQRYLDAALAAVEWLKKSRLPDGQWARFYELGTNKPLYFDMTYELTYSADDAPKHYSFKGQFNIPVIIARAEALRDGKPDPSSTPAKDAEEIEEAVREILSALDPQGRWVEKNWLKSSTFVRNMGYLAAYVAANAPAPAVVPGGSAPGTPLADTTRLLPLLGRKGDGQLKTQ